MSTLTKIFIVLMVVFSIAFTMTMISFVAKTTDWKGLATDYRNELQIVETHMRKQAAAHAAEKTAWLDTKGSLEDRIANLQASETEMSGQIAKLEDDSARLKAENNSSSALAHRLTTELQVAQAGWLEQRDQRKEIEQRNMELERRNIDLNERVNELTSQVLVLVQQQNQLEQQVNILRDENQKLAQGVRPEAGAAVFAGGAGGVEPVSPATTTPIRGRIVEVQGDLATISVGSADGVQPGTVFVIYRGSDYIGDLKITDVEPDLAAGRVIHARATPRADDMVADEPALGMAQ